MTAAAREWAAAQALPPDERAVLSYLAAIQGEGWDWPSQRTIAAFTRRSPEAVRKALGGLRRRGLVEWRTGRGTVANDYTLHTAGPTQPGLPTIEGNRM
jgi:hypothetical protein